LRLGLNEIFYEDSKKPAIDDPNVFEVQFIRDGKMEILCELQEYLIFNSAVYKWVEFLIVLNV